MSTFTNAAFRPLQSSNISSEDCAQLMKVIKIIVYILIIISFFALLSMLLEWATGIQIILLLVGFFIVLYLGFVVTTSCFEDAQIVRIVS